MTTASTLRKKVFIIILAALAGLLAIIYGIAQPLLLNSFDRLERERVQQSVDRVADALDGELTSLGMTAGDWNERSELGRFIRAAPRGTPLPAPIFTAFSVNLIIIVDTAGEVLFQGSSSPNQRQQAPAPISLLKQISRDFPLLHHGTAGAINRGYLVLPEGILLLASHPIIGESAGGFRGTVLMGRFLSEPILQRLSETAETRFSIEPPELPAGATASFEQHPYHGRPNLVYFPDRTSVTGSVIMTGITGQPAFALKVVLPRDIRQEGITAVRSLALALLIGGLLFGTVVIILMDRTFFSRLARLDTEVRAISIQYDPTERVSVTGNDELARLARTVNGMLEAIHSSEVRYRTLVEQLPAITYSARGDDTGVTDYISPKVEEVLGYSPTEWQAEPNLWAGLLHPDDRDRVLTAVASAHKNRTPFSCEYRMIARNGRTIWIADHFERLKNGAGAKGAILGLMFDVTARRHMEGTLRESERRYRATMENIRLLAVELDTDGTMVFGNSFLLELTSWQRPEVTGKKWFDVFIPPGDTTSRAIFFSSILSGTIPLNIENEIITRSGERRLVAWNNTILYDDEGRIMGTASIGEDITERRHAEETLMESLRLQQAILDNIPDIAWLKDREGRYIAVNEAFCRATGFPQDKVIGMPDDRLWPPEQAAVYLKNDRQVIQAAHALTFEEELCDLQGRRLMMETVKTPITGPRGDIIGTTGIARDITSRKRTEDTLRYLSTHDTLTKLYNRLFFEEEMERLERGRLYPVSIISADAEGLKEVNDREGHAGGDLLLRRIASLLSATLRSDDVIARVGGDEFAVLLAMTDEATVAEIIRRIRTRLTEESGTIIGLSLGAATARKGDRLIDTLNKADDAMYRDKYQRTGRHSRRTFPSTPCPHEEPEPL